MERRTASWIAGAVVAAPGAAVLLAAHRPWFELGWRPRGAFEVGMVAAALALLAAGAAVAASQRPGVRAAGTRAAVVVASAVAALVVADVAVARWRRARLAAEFHVRPAGLSRTVTPDPAAVPGVAATARYTVNSCGVRGPELPDDPAVPRVLCLGGSAAECTYLDDDRAWTGRLGRILSAPGRAVWSGGAGRNAYASLHHEAFLVASPLVDRVDCVVALVGVNDVLHGLAGAAPHDEERAREIAGREPPPDVATRPAWARSALVAALRERAAGAGPPRPPAELEDDRGEAHVLRRDLRRRAGRGAIGRADLELAADAFGIGVHGMIEAARARGVRLVLVPQPVLWSAGLAPEHEALLWTGRLHDGTFLPAADLRALADAYAAELRLRADAAGVEVVDVSAMNGDARWFYDDCHLTDAGSEELARRVAAWLAARPVTPRRL